jgi:ribosomal protein S18 acetylase RimI-like enzyme
MSGDIAMSCHPAKAEDIDQVAAVHIDAFPGFFLTDLGPAFLRTMYKAFLLNHGGIFVVDDHNGIVGGFAVGVLKSAGKDRNLAIRFMPQFAFSLVPAILKNPIKVTRRIASQFFATGEEVAIPGDAVVLRSIGVKPSLKGEGVAGRLLEEFEHQARKKGAALVALTTDAIDNERAIGFYRKNGYTIAQEFKQDGSRSMYLMVKKLLESS